MNQSEPDQVAHLLSDAVEDITYSPEELAARLAQVKAHSTPVPAAPSPAVVTRRTTAAESAASQEVAGSERAVYGSLALASSTGPTAPGNNPLVSGGSRSMPLRVDAQRNLEHVLRAAREVFGELGYGASMEDVARRARVGVGTVYRRFPSRDVLVRRIAEEEVARLTDLARTALGQEDDPWAALTRFLRTAVAAGAGRLLPDLPSPADPADGPPGPYEPEPDSDWAGLVSVLSQLVSRAQASGDLRDDVTVADIIVVLGTASAPSSDSARYAAATARLLDIILAGLRRAPA